MSSLLTALCYVTIKWLVSVLKHSSTVAYSFPPFSDTGLTAGPAAVLTTNAASLVCYLGNRRAVMAWGVWTCPTWERMRLFPDAEGLLCTPGICLACSHTQRQPLYLQFYTGHILLLDYTGTFPARWTRVVDPEKKGENKGSKALWQPFFKLLLSPVKVWDLLNLRLSHGNLPEEEPHEPWTCLQSLLPQPTLLLLSCMRL